MSERGEDRMREYERKLRDLAIPATSVSGSGRVSVPGIGEMRISGSGHVSSEEVRVSGSGSMPGGFRVGRIRSSGSFSIGGDIEADEMHFSGSASVMGNIYAKSLTTSGSFKAGGGAVGGSMRFSGSCRIGGAVQLEDSLTAHGSLTVSGDVAAQNIVDLKGSFDIEGKLTTGTFKAELSHSRSYVEKGIQADSVDVRRRSRDEGLVLFGFTVFGRRFREGELSTTDIVGKEKVYLENVYCDNVVGRDVTIGEGCEIRGRVRYSGTVEVHPKARVMNAPEKEG